MNAEKRTVARIISPDCDDRDHAVCGDRFCGCTCHPNADHCWRSECRNGCYYPDVCSERGPAA